MPSSSSDDTAPNSNDDDNSFISSNPPEMAHTMRSHLSRVSEAVSRLEASISDSQQPLHSQSTPHRTPSNKNKSKYYSLNHNDDQNNDDDYDDESTATNNENPLNLSQPNSSHSPLRHRSRTPNNNRNLNQSINVADESYVITPEQRASSQGSSAGNDTSKRMEGLSSVKKKIGTNNNSSSNSNNNSNSNSNKSSSESRHTNHSTSNISTDINTLRAKLTESETARSALFTVITKARTELSLISNNTATAQRNQAIAEAKSISLIRDIEGRDLEIGNLEWRLNDINSKYERERGEVVKEVDYLKGEIGELWSRLEGQNEKQREEGEVRKELMGEIEGKQRKIDAIMNEFGEYKTSQSNSNHTKQIEHDNKVSNLQNRINQLKSSSSNHQNEQLQNTNINSQQQQKMSTLKAEITTIKIQLEDKNSKMITAKDEIESWKAEVRRNERKVNEISGNLRDVENTVNSLRGDNRELDSKLRSMVNNLDDEKSKNSGFSDLDNEKDGKIKSFEGEVKTLSNTVSKLQHESEVSESKLKVSNAKQNEIEATCERQNTVITTLESDVDSLNKIVNDGRLEKDRLGLTRGEESRQFMLAMGFFRRELEGMSEEFVDYEGSDSDGDVRKQISNLQKEKASWREHIGLLSEEAATFASNPKSPIKPDLNSKRSDFTSPLKLLPSPSTPSTASSNFKQVAQLEHKIGELQNQLSTAEKKSNELKSPSPTLSPTPTSRERELEKQVAWLQGELAQIELNVERRDYNGVAWSSNSDYYDHSRSYRSPNKSNPNQSQSRSMHDDDDDDMSKSVVEMDKAKSYIRVKAKELDDWETRLGVQQQRVLKLKEEFNKEKEKERRSERNSTSNTNKLELQHEKQTKEYQQQVLELSHKLGGVETARETLQFTLTTLQTELSSTKENHLNETSQLRNKLHGSESVNGTMQADLYRLKTQIDEEREIRSNTHTASVISNQSNMETLKSNLQLFQTQKYYEEQRAVDAMKREDDMAVRLKIRDTENLESKVLVQTLNLKAERMVEEVESVKREASKRVKRAGDSAVEAAEAAENAVRNAEELRVVRDGLIVEADVLRGKLADSLEALEAASITSNSMPLLIDCTSQTDNDNDNANTNLPITNSSSSSSSALQTTISNLLNEATTLRRDLAIATTSKNCSDRALTSARERLKASIAIASSSSSSSSSSNDSGEAALKLVRQIEGLEEQCEVACREAAAAQVGWESAEVKGGRMVEEARVLFEVEIERLTFELRQASDGATPSTSTSTAQIDVDIEAERKALLTLTRTLTSQAQEQALSQADQFASQLLKVRTAQHSLVRREEKMKEKHRSSTAKKDVEIDFLKEKLRGTVEGLERLKVKEKVRRRLEEEQRVIEDKSRVELEMLNSVSHDYNNNNNNDNGKGDSEAAATAAVESTNKIRVALSTQQQQLKLARREVSEVCGGFFEELDRLAGKATATLPTLHHHHKEHHRSSQERGSSTKKKMSAIKGSEEEDDEEDVNDFIHRPPSTPKTKIHPSTRDISEEVKKQANVIKGLHSNPGKVAAKTRTRGGSNTN